MGKNVKKLSLSIFVVVIIVVIFFCILTGINLLIPLKSSDPDIPPVFPSKQTTQTGWIFIGSGLFLTAAVILGENYYIFK